MTEKTLQAIARIKLELCRMETKYNANYYELMMDEYCAMKKILQDRLRELEAMVAA